MQLDNDTVCGEGLTPCPRPAPTLAISDRITHKQNALGELNELNDHNEPNDRSELNDRNDLILNYHNHDAIIQRVNMRSPSNGALIVLITPSPGCDETIN